MILRIFISFVHEKKNLASKQLLGAQEKKLNLKFLTI